MKAQHDTECAHCGYWIKVGQEYVNLGNGRSAHGCCVSGGDDE